MTRRTATAAAAAAILLTAACATKTWTDCYSPTAPAAQTRWRSSDPPPLNATECGLAHYAAAKIFTETKNRCVAEERPETKCCAEANDTMCVWAAKNYPTHCIDRQLECGR